MIDAKRIIIELAEYLKGERGDPNGYYASFFQRKIRGNFEGVAAYLVENSIVAHHSAVIDRMAERKVSLDNWKRRAYDFENGMEIVNRVGDVKSFK